LADCSKPPEWQIQNHRQSSGDINRFGFDMAFPAVFLVLLRSMWKGFEAARPWLVSLVCAALAYLYLPAGWYVPIGALSGIASAFFLIQEDQT
jgi:predicted branched-subunit amino acid permease